MRYLLFFSLVLVANLVFGANSWLLTYDPATAKNLGITLTPDQVTPPSTSDTWALSYDPAAAQTLTITLSPKSAPPPPPPDWDTEVLGQSQTTQWGPYFKSPGWQFRIKTGSGYMNWMNATDSIWTAPEKLYSSDGTPIVPYADIERVIITVGKAPQDVGVTGTYESLLDKTIATVRTKYPNLKEIRLQPLAAGPNKSLCSSGGQNVLTTVNLPAIEKAISTLTDKYTDVTIGSVPLVDNCSEFADATGHLTDPTGRQDIAAKVAAYYGSATPPPPPPPPSSACNVNMAGFKLIGDPASTSGATWTYVSNDGGIGYNLKGILFSPPGSGPFPGGIVSHGLGGTAPIDAAKKFRDWGMVAIGTNYTHSSDTSGLPAGDQGASTANIQRAHKTWDILCGLGTVDMTRIAAHGHSMGAFVTAGLLGTYPNDFKVASHSAGGVSDSKLPVWTSSVLANGIKAPYQMHHGDQDTTVPLKDDQTLDSLLTAKGTVHELKVYAGYSHSAVRTDPLILDTVKQWYTQHNLFSTAPPPPPPPPPTGSGAIASDIYVVDDGDADFAKALASDVVKGALVRVQWTQLEASEGKYSFTNLCSKITQAHALGKGVALVNYPLPPTWLVSKVPTSDRWTLPLGARSVATIVPWNTTLLAAMQKLAEAEANYVCGGYPIKNHPALRQVDDTVAGALSVRDVPTGAALSQMTEAVTSSVKIWHNAFPGNYAHFMGIFPLGRTSTAVADASTIGKSVLAMYPDEHFFMENWDIKGPGGTMADPLKLAKYKIIQACNYFSQPDRIKCSGSGVSGNTPGAAYDKILKPMGGVMSVQIYPDDILYPAYAAELKMMAAELGAQ